MFEFWNRSREIAEIRNQLQKGIFGYVTGRRRVGKTALLVKASETFGGLYHQAVEGTPQQQLLHLAEEFSPALPIFRDIIPRSWSEFFSLLSKEKLPPLLIFDEFPYWVQSDATLPSILQKWIDHELPQFKTTVFVSGSSQSMLYSQFLNPSLPLYGRASMHLHLEPLSYRWFCRALSYDTSDPISFERFSLVGGVPHYWKLMRSGSLVQQASHLYFEPSAILAEEPIQLLRDEQITGTLPKAILDFIGRGVAKPGELAARLGVPHGNLSRPLSMLLELGLIRREMPFGESTRTTKKMLYTLQDPALAFYYGTFLSLRSRWNLFTQKEKEKFLHQHASRQWEQYCRLVHPGSARYWEGPIEIDLVAPLEDQESYLIAECKWTPMSQSQEKDHLQRLKEQFSKTQLSQKLKKVTFRIFSQKDLERLAKLED